MWEMIKLKTREQSIKYAKDRRTKTSRREEEIEKAIDVLQELIESSSRDLEEEKTELEIIIEYRTTKYFLNLEKRHFKTALLFN